MVFSNLWIICCSLVPLSVLLEAYWTYSVCGFIKFEKFAAIVFLQIYFFCLHFCGLQWCVCYTAWRCSNVTELVYFFNFPLSTLRCEYFLMQCVQVHQYFSAVSAVKLILCIFSFQILYFSIPGIPLRFFFFSISWRKGHMVETFLISLYSCTFLFCRRSTVHSTISI